MSEKGYEDFLSAEAPMGLYSFHWPVAVGDWWSPNICPVNAHFRHTPTERREYAPGDLVNVLISNAKDYFRNEVPGLHRISFWGGDDHCLSMHDADQTMTTAEVKQFLRELPNPVSMEWLWSLRKNGKPLFQSGLPPKGATTMSLFHVECDRCAASVPVNETRKEWHPVRRLYIHTCHRCDATEARQSMRSTGSGLLALDWEGEGDNRSLFRLTGCHGRLSFPCRTKAGPRASLYVWFVGPDGYEWHGRHASRTSRTVRVRRTRTRITALPAYSTLLQQTVLTVREPFLGSLCRGSFWAEESIMSLSKVEHIWLRVGSETWGSFAWESATEQVRSLLALPGIGRKGIEIKVAWDNGALWVHHASIHTLLGRSVDSVIGCNLLEVADDARHPHSETARGILGACELPSWHEYARLWREAVPELSRYLPEEVLA